MKFKNNDNVRTMFSIFGQHNNKRPIKLYASFVGFFDDMQKSLIQPKTYVETKACTEESDEEVSLIDM